ncbi:hypothetical protein Mapa_009030 [Marchantia paleacea]|nr:hypothetical protein Mapa_009030 [Marchantia paleacea]
MRSPFFSTLLSNSTRFLKIVSVQGVMRSCGRMRVAVKNPLRNLMSFMLPEPLTILMPAFRSCVAVAIGCVASFSSGHSHVLCCRAPQYTHSRRWL